MHLGGLGGCARLGCGAPPVQAPRQEVLRTQVSQEKQGARDNEQGCTWVHPLLPSLPTLSPSSNKARPGFLVHVGPCFLLLQGKTPMDTNSTYSLVKPSYCLTPFKHHTDLQVWLKGRYHPHFPDEDMRLQGLLGLSRFNSQRVAWSAIPGCTPSIDLCPDPLSTRSLLSLDSASGRKPWQHVGKGQSLREQSLQMGSRHQELSGCIEGSRNEPGWRDRPAQRVVKGRESCSEGPADQPAGHGLHSSPQPC